CDLYFCFPVRRALAAIERDPIKKSVPLVSESHAQYELAKISLNKLENLLKKQGIIANNQKLSWNNLNKIIYPLITKAQSKTIKKQDIESKIWNINPYFQSAND
ncbi:MAG: hypothetical protein QNJ37_15825, partial [Crocosphaera sp.]|nr:hypothetical protein [Crocosphaera sp.]